MAIISNATVSATIASLLASKPYTMRTQESIICRSSSRAFLTVRRNCFCHDVSSCHYTMWTRKCAPHLSGNLLPPRTAPHALKRARTGIRTLPVGFVYSSRLRSVSNFRSVVAKLQDEKQQEVGTAEIAAIASGLIAIPVIAWSLYTLKTTGCGLPPGPGGAIGALEGVSYLVILGLIGWSIYTKVKTGSGLPSGPFGLLGAVEGLSFLTVLAIAVVFGLQYLDYGYIPGPVPGEQCFG